MYDIIGDIHGHLDELVELLDRLGYTRSNGTFSHPSRKAVFVGDLIDRGPRIRATLQLVRSMCESGSALVVMGNHEFNALAYHTPDSSKPGEYLREHSEKNSRQHAATLRQVPEDELKDHLEWFRSLPLWLELDGLRVVHACWDSRQIAALDAARKKYSGVSTDFLREATTPGELLSEAIEDVLKGKEIRLPHGGAVVDKDGQRRHSIRVKWFAPAEHATYASYAFTVDGDLPDDPLPWACLESAEPYPADAVPVFFGHYWLRSDRPAPLAVNVACLDYSVAKDGSLCAYRWDGERVLSGEKFHCVKSTRP